MEVHRKLLQLQDYAPYSATRSLPLHEPPLTISFPPTASTPLPPLQHLSVALFYFLVAVFFLSVISAVFCLGGSDPPRRTSSPPPDVPPMSKVTIQALPVFPYMGEASCQEDCAICLGEFEEEEALKKIPFCKHIFHPGCLDKWLSLHATCPLCRSTQMFEDADSKCV